MIVSLYQAVGTIKENPWPLNKITSLAVLNFAKIVWYSVEKKFNIPKRKRMKIFGLSTEK